MEFFKSQPHIDFFGIRRWAGGFSIVLCLLSLISFAILGLNLGLDFVGGVQVEMSFREPQDIGSIRDRLGRSGFAHVDVQHFGSAQSIALTLPSEGDHSVSSVLPQKLVEALPGAVVNRVDLLGAKVSQELARQGFLSLVIALFATLAYIGFRFEWKLAAGAVVAVLHDPIVILGVFSVFRVPFDLTVLAAVLTILGYSLHNTVVVFDRIRENFRTQRQGSPAVIVNDSINQTLSRTVMSSGLTLSVICVLYALGGPTIRAFSLALIIGILVGTYSSIYVSGSFAVAIGLSKHDLLVKAKPVRGAVV